MKFRSETGLCSFTIAPVRITFTIFGMLLLSALGLCQADTPEKKAQQPQVRVNYLNVCTPSEAEKAEIASALDKLPARPKFATDYEIARGRSSMTDDALIAAGEGAKMSDGPPSISDWVRVRKEFPTASPYSNVQYSFSVSGDKAVETLVFRLRDPKDLLQLSLSDSVLAPPNAADVVKTATPADRIRLERFGKSSVVLARCPNADQSSYEALFAKASSLLNAYRDVLGVRRIVPQELPRSAQPKPAKPAAQKPKQ